MPTSSINTASSVRAAAAVSAKAVMDVLGKVSTEKPVKRSGRTESRASAVISAPMWCGSSGWPLISSSGQARIRNRGSLCPNAVRRSISVCRPACVNGQRTSAKTSTVRMAADYRDSRCATAP